KDHGKTGNRSLELILQEDKTDETDAVSGIGKSWKERFAYAPAVVSGPNRVFANSYHTKVAVRDGSAFWLSSGNWSPNSQPQIPDGPQPTIYRLGNREWHVIVEDRKLAGIFEKFIDHDFHQALEAAQKPAPEGV